MRGGRSAALAATVILALVGATAAQGALPEVESGHRPGPDVLYASPPRAPQLENTGVWRADPILVSGTSAYREGEFLYQDYLYDDHGARGTRDPNDPFSFEEFAFSPKWGTLTYPRDRAFAENAADLVELRVKPLGGETAIRVTLNSLADPERTAFTVALGTSATPRAWPHSAGVSSPAAQFLTVHGGTAELRDAGTGTVVSPAPSVSLDRERRQFDVRVPRAAWDPGSGTVRMAAGVGLWDPGADRYLAPAPVSNGSTPGGRAPSGAALFNMAFRFAEPAPEVANPAINTIGEGAVAAGAEAAHWRERQQGDTLQGGDVSAFGADVDFAKLAAGTNDDSRVPKTGHINRIHASRFIFGQGVDHKVDCSITFSQEFPCNGRFVGQLQPYTVYVPAKARPSRGYGFTLLMHGLSGNHNEFLETRHARQLGDRGAGSIVAAPLGRGPDGFYQDIAEGDVFEVWNDVARHYELDPSWVSLSGYSMGGIGTYRLAYRWPDLFARGAPIVGFAGEEEQLPSLRNIPMMAWNAGQDELVNVTRYEPTHERMFELDVSFISDIFNPAGHITLAANDEFGPQADFLGEHRVNRDPPHVTYVVAPRRDSPRAQAVADHAYWLSGLRVRDPDNNERGTIDAHSSAFGKGDPPVNDASPSAGTLTGGSRPLAYVRRSQTYGPVPSIPKRNFLDLNLEGIERASVAGERARLDGDSPLTVRLRSDGTGSLRLNVPLPAGATVERVDGPAVPGAAAARAGVRAAASAPEVALSRRGALIRTASGSRTYVINPADADGAGGSAGGNGSGSGSGSGGSGDTAGAAGSGGGGSLPFTGFTIALLVLAGATLAVAGQRLRKKSR